MKIKQAKYLLTAVRPDQYPQTILPAVSFCGRSNVGKSSLINALLNRRNLARTSSQPGKTRTINFFEVQSVLGALGAEGRPADWYLVDLPGYGYAKVSKQERDSWRSMIEKYLQGWPGPNLFLQLVDIRHEPSVLDKQMWQYLQAFCADHGERADCRLVITKADKISKGARERQLAMIAKSLAAPRQQMLTFSVPAKEGRDELLVWLEEYLTEYLTEIGHERNL